MALQMTSVNNDLLMLFPLPAVPLRFRCHKEGPLEVSLNTSTVTTALHCTVCDCVVFTSELEVSLLVLPFPYVPELLTLFNSYIQQGQEVELVCRCLFFLLK